MTNTARVAWLERDALFAWLGKYPRVAVDMLQVLANRMRANNERISDLVFMDVPARLAKTLLSLATRFGEPVEAGLKVPHDLTQEELAQLVGSSRETVNKALMDFSNRGWIAREGRAIIIYKPGMLIRRSRR
jgi:CRP-like cAMP-binding protein